MSEAPRETSIERALRKGTVTPERIIAAMIEVEQQARHDAQFYARKGNNPKLFKRAVAEREAIRTIMDVAQGVVR